MFGRFRSVCGRLLRRIFSPLANFCGSLFSFLGFCNFEGCPLRQGNFWLLGGCEEVFKHRILVVAFVTFNVDEVG